jgi:phytoene dehydrogenase-like protein
LGFTHYSTILVPEWLRSLSDYSRNAALLAGAPAKDMPLMAVVDYSAIDSGLNSAGLHLVSVVGLDRVANWEGLDTPAYQSKRDQWLAAIVAEIDRTFPGFARAVVQREMATAVTMHRYLNTPAGAL